VLREATGGRRNGEDGASRISEDAKIFRGHIQMRERLPDTRRSINHKLVLCHTKGNGKIERLHFYLVIGMYGDGRPAELFITVNKGNDTISGFCKVFGILISLCLQSGVPLDKLYEKLAHQDFEPKGFTENKDIHSCSSVVDYVMKFMHNEFNHDPKP
jgi:ribonucleoside-diphosphate reductase alpha chain